MVSSSNAKTETTKGPNWIMVSWERKLKKERNKCRGFLLISRDTKYIINSLTDPK